MNSVSPASVQYGSPSSRRKTDVLRNLSAHQEQTKMGYQGAARDAETDEVDKLKSKLMTAWNNKDFVSRMWLTYRRDFPALEGTQLTTDCGWGCMIRSAQMLLAQALLVHLLNRDWFWPEALITHFVEMDPIRSSSPSNMRPFPPSLSASCQPSRIPTPWESLPHRRVLQHPHQEQIHRDILKWLADHPNAPFGLHHMVKLGESLGKKAGDWYGPSIVAHILRKALENSSQVPELSVYVSQDCTVYKADVEQLLDPEDSLSGNKHGGRAVIILVPVRLGGEHFNPVYKQCIKVLSSPAAEEKYPVFSISDGQAQEFHAPEGLAISSFALARHKRSAMTKRPSSDEFEFL
uniref:Cysteine protease n=1 Tax=Pyxicephalus adspersus TaxID=30357 RepID=A0AAV3A887_PYXAD|nr:TPA: hypothetical protein GDO54_014708 [Pyxicephalus adspersus]